MPCPTRAILAAAFEEILMKRLLTSAAILALVSVPAFAAANQKSVSFPEAVTVGATQLPAGDYKVTWTGTGSNVQVSFEQKGKGAAPAVVTAKAEDEKESHTGFTVNRQGSVNQLEALQLGKTTLSFSAAPSNGQ